MLFRSEGEADSTGSVKGACLCVLREGEVVVLDNLKAGRGRSSWRWVKEEFENERDAAGASAFEGEAGKERAAEVLRTLSSSSSTQHLPGPLAALNTPPIAESPVH